MPWMCQVCVAMRSAVQGLSALEALDVWQSTLDSLLYTSIWVAGSQRDHREEQRRCVHRLCALLMVGSCGVTPADLEPDPVQPGLCCVPPHMAEMGGMWEQVRYLADVLQNVLRGRERVKAVALALSWLEGRSRELAWCVAAMVLMRSMEEDPRV